MAPEGQQDDFQYVQENYKVGVCRVGAIAQQLEAFLQYETDFALDEASLEAVFRHKLGMEKAVWREGKPHAKATLESPSTPMVDGVEAYDQYMVHVARLQEANARLEAQDEKQTTEILALRQEKIACLQAIDRLRGALRQQQDAKTLALQRLEAELQQANLRYQDQALRLTEAEQHLTLQSKRLALLEAEGAMEDDERTLLRATVEHLQHLYDTLREQKAKAEAESVALKARYEVLLEAQKERERAHLRALQAVVLPPVERSLPSPNLKRQRPFKTFVAGAISDGLRARIATESLLWDWAESLSTFRIEGLHPSRVKQVATTEIHAAWMVLSNLLSRGLPSRPTPALEAFLAKVTGEIYACDDAARLCFEMTAPERLYRLKAGIEAMQTAGFKPAQCALWSCERALFQLFYQPFLAARVQKALLEAFLSGALPFQSKLRVLALEHDITGVARALAELETMLQHLFALMGQATVKVPRFEVETIPLQPASACFYEGSTCISLEDALHAPAYDLVLETAFFEREDSFEAYLETIPCTCALTLLSSAKAAEPYLYTTKNLCYRPLGAYTQAGLFEADEAMEGHLTYFLQFIFRWKRFLPGQLPILHRALQGQSVIGLLPTGGGKSLTYQLAALLQPGVCLVISPLKSLMFDQVDSLQKEGITLCDTLNSDLSQAASETMLETLSCGHLKFLFVSPERLQVPSFRSTLYAMSALGLWFAYGVIDEVHCVSEWGHDFRLSYLHLGRNLQRYVKAAADAPLPLVGLTATATFDVLIDVEQTLSGVEGARLGPDAIVRLAHPHRLELQYLVRPMGAPTTSMPSALTRSAHWRLKRKAIVQGEPFELARQCFEDCAQPEALARIYHAFCEREHALPGTPRFAEIYRQKITLPVNDIFEEDLEGALQLKASSGALFFCPTAGGEGGAYGLYDALLERIDAARVGVFSSTKPRDEAIEDEAFYALNRSTQAAFKANQLQLLVATKAFSLGIDKSNIRLVVETCHPASLEALTQAFGRAGRDRKLALCLLYYAEEDNATSLYFHHKNFVGQVSEAMALGYLWNAEIFQHAESTVRESLSSLIEMATEPRLIVHLDLKPFGERHQPTWEREDLTMRRTWEAYARKHPTLRPQASYLLLTTSLIKKVLYRLSLLGLVDDLLEDYDNQRLTLYLKVQDEAAIYRALQAFLERYYMPHEAEAMVRAWGEAPCEANAYLNAMAHLTDFIYEKIEVKRRRAIEEVQAFCRYGCDERNGASWLERNEGLKDYLYYTFNSKYLRHGYSTPDGASASLYDDTEGGKRSELSLLWKYMRLVDSHALPPSESPKDNLKHLHGAVRLLRQVALGEHPTLALLDGFCSLMISPPQTSSEAATLFETLFHQGFGPLAKTLPLGEVIALVDTYFKTLTQLYVNLSPRACQRLKHLILVTLLSERVHAIVAEHRAP
jgi:ATP-dependent DNA helicase RecQ